MATLSEQLTDVRAELVLIKSQMAALSADGQDVSHDGMSVRSVSYSDLVKQRTALEKREQRLLRGGRGFEIDMSQGVTE